MVEKSKEDRLSLTVVALVALVAIVSLAAIVLNGNMKVQNALPTMNGPSAQQSNVAGAAEHYLVKNCNQEETGKNGCVMGYWDCKVDPDAPHAYHCYFTVDDK